MRKHGAKHKYIGFIPLRGGSKSIPLKNIKKIAGRPLAYWALDAAVGCQKIEHVYVSTDSDEIKKVVEEYGSKKVTVIERSAESATDTASTELALLEFAHLSICQKIVLIQATSPLVKSADIARGIELIESQNADSLVSVVLQKRFKWALEKDLSARPLNYSPEKRPQRQDFEGEYVENGAFYISDRQMLISTRSRLHGSIVGLPMIDQTYLELDELSDWIAIEGLLKNGLDLSVS